VADASWLCYAGLPELKGPLGPGEELVTLTTRLGVTVRLLLIIPNSVPKGAFLFFPGNADDHVPNTLRVQQVDEFEQIAR